MPPYHTDGTFHLTVIEFYWLDLSNEIIIVNFIFPLDLPDITYVGENLFVIERGDLVIPQHQMITINLFTVDSRNKKRQTTDTPSLNVNVTIDPTQKRFRVPRERLVDGQTYTVRVSETVLQFGENFKMFSNTGSFDCC